VVFFIYFFFFYGQALPVWQPASWKSRTFCSKLRGETMLGRSGCS